MEKFTKGYVDVVVQMRTDKAEARKFLHRQLYELRNQITREHYFEMYEYIDKATNYPKRPPGRHQEPPHLV